MAHPKKRVFLDPTMTDYDDEAYEMPTLDEHTLQSLKLLKDMFAYPYQGDLFGSEGNDNTNGLLYLSRMDLDSDPVRREKRRQMLQQAEHTSKEGSAEKPEETDEEKPQPVHRRDKKRRFAKSLCTLAAKPRKRGQIVRDGAIPTLIKLSRLPDRQTQMHCAQTFCYLTAEASIRSRMIEEGALAAIITLSQTVTSKRVHLVCIKALCNLAAQPGHEAMLVRDGVIDAMRAISVASPHVLHVCFITTLNLSCVDDKYTKVEDVNAIVLEFAALIAQDRRSFSPEMESVVLCALCNLSGLKNNQQRLLEEGCISLIDTFYRSGHFEIRTLCAAIMFNLSTCIRTRNKLPDHRAVPLLLRMSADTVELVQVECVKTLHNMSLDRTCREHLVANGAVPAIVDMCMEDFSDVQIGRMSARTLRILCGDQNLTDRLIDNGIIRALMSLIKTDDVHVRQFCAESLCALFQYDAGLSALISQGAVDIMGSLAMSTTDEITADWCAFALYHLVVNKSCPLDLLREGILQSLIRLSGLPSMHAQSFCVAALAMLTNKRQFDASPAIPVLVDLLRQDINPSIKSQVASALYNLATDDSNCEKMLDVGALMPIVELTQCDEATTRVQCAAILSRLSSHTNHLDEFLSDGFIDALLDLSRMEHQVTQLRVVVALVNLTMNPEARAKLRSRGTAECLIALMSRPYEELRLGCSAALCNLSYDVGCEKDMVDKGVVQTLLITSTVASDRRITKKICLKALVNLLHDDKVHTAMVKQGVVWGLAALVRVDDSGMQELCGRALCNLSSRFPKDVLQSRTAVQAVFKLVASDVKDAQMCGAKALYNILLESTEEDESTRRESVRFVKTLAQSEEDELRELCVVCLCLVSQSDTCRSEIVRQGVLDLIDASVIFTKRHVSFAYVTMFSNIASQVSMRTQVLDDNCISRLEQVCSTHDPTLDFAVAKALYSVSCAEENMQRLVDQNSIRVIEDIFAASNDDDVELCHYLTAFLYNLTTSPSVQAAVVQQGLVALMRQLWDAEISQDVGLLVARGMCNLGTGCVNSTRMVQDGATPIFCAIAERYPAEESLTGGAAASLRNLLCVSSNQVTMVEQQAIQALVTLSTVTGVPETQRINCAAALRSMTYNVRVRHILVESGAIELILDDSRREEGADGDDLNMNTNLLVAIEAESWTNGSRGLQREGRAPKTAPAPLCTSLVRSEHTVKLDTEPRSAELSKSHEKSVGHVLKEPALEQSATLTMVTRSLDNLSAFSMNADLMPYVMFCPKRAVDVDEPHRRGSSKRRHPRLSRGHSGNNTGRDGEAGSPSPTASNDMSRPGTADSMDSHGSSGSGKHGRRHLHGPGTTHVESSTSALHTVPPASPLEKIRKGIIYSRHDMGVSRGGSAFVSDGDITDTDREYTPSPALTDKDRPDTAEEEKNGPQTTQQDPPTIDDGSGRGLGVPAGSVSTNADGSSLEAGSAEDDESSVDTRGTPKAQDEEIGKLAHSLLSQSSVGAEERTAKEADAGLPSLLGRSPETDRKFRADKAAKRRSAGRQQEQRKSRSLPRLNNSGGSSRSMSPIRGASGGMRGRGDGRTRRKLTQREREEGFNSLVASINNRSGSVDTILDRWKELSAP